MGPAATCSYSAPTFSKWGQFYGVRPFASIRRGRSGSVFASSTKYEDPMLPTFSRRQAPSINVAWV